MKMKPKLRFNGFDFSLSFRVKHDFENVYIKIENSIFVDFSLQ